MPLVTDFLAGALTPAVGEILHIVDPAGIWHDFGLACPRTDQAPVKAIDGGVLSSETSSGVEERIRHAVPGIADSDVIEYAAYPGEPERRGVGSFAAERSWPVLSYSPETVRAPSWLRPAPPPKSGRHARRR